MEASLVTRIKKINFKKGITHSIFVAFYNVAIPWAIAIITCKLSTISNLFYALFPFVSFYTGTRFRAINNMSHECIHFSFCKRKKINEFFGEIFAILEFSKFLSIRKEHLTHHKYLGDMNRDLDFNGLRKYGLHKRLTRLRVMKHFRETLFLKQIKDTFFLLLMIKMLRYGLIHCASFIY